MSPGQDIISVLSFDPGTTNMGWAYSHYHIPSKLLTVHQVGTIMAIRQAEKQKASLKVADKQTITIQVVAEAVTQLLDTYDPDYVASEAAFYNPRRPQAYVVLSLCVYTISRMLYDRYRQQTATKVTAAKVHTFAPWAIKAAICPKAGGKKEAVRQGVSTHPQILIPALDVATFGEHEIDAVACGYTFAKKTF